jgi:hypothetical protein
MTGPLVLIIELPDDWSTVTAGILAERLVNQELPPGLIVQLANWRDDDEGHNTLRVWETP